MYGSKLINILQSLSKIELNQAGDLIHSPFFNKNDAVKALFNYLYNLYPKYSEENTAREEVYAKVYTSEAFDEQRLRYIMSDLTKLLEQYLMITELRDKEQDENQLLIQAFQKRDLIKYVQPLVDRSLSLQKKNKYRDSSFYEQTFNVERATYEYLSVKRNVAVKENLESIIENLDIYYIINKLKYTSEIINHTNVMAGKYEPLLLDEIMNYLNHTRHTEIPAIAIYHQVLLTLLYPDKEEYYRELKRLLREHIDKFPQDEINDMYIFARNYCAKKINSGALEYLQEMFDLYKILLKKGLLFESGFLSQWDYKNIVVVGLKLDEYDWVEEFINDYKKLIRPEERENVYKMNLALLYFYRKKYHKTLELIRDIEFTDVYYHLNCKMILLETYYELEEIDPLYSLTDSIYNYLRRNKQISEYQRDTRFIFLRFVKKLIRIRYRDKKYALQLREELVEQKQVYNYTWLIKKIDELIT